MKRYVDFMTGKAKDHLVEHGLGDWLSPRTQTPAIITSSGYYYVDATILAKAAAMLGKTDDAKRFGDLAEAIRRSYNKTLYKGNGIYANGSQTALACPLYQGLVAPEEKGRVVAELAANVRRCGDHLDTGFLGTKYLLPALTDNGQNELAFRIATQTTPPSWGDWVKRGATTLWEDWGGSGSLNHFAFGVIGEWFYKSLAGIDIDPNRPAFKHIIIRPRPVGDLKWVRARHESPYGTVACQWRREEKSLIVTVTVPPNTTAEVHLPAQSPQAVTESGHSAEKAVGVKFLRMEDGAAVFAVESGEYRFQVLSMEPTG
jgi:alpha-L-rhamnosidase